MPVQILRVAVLEEEMVSPDRPHMGGAGRTVFGEKDRDTMTREANVVNLGRHAG